MSILNFLRAAICPDYATNTLKFSLENGATMLAGEIRCILKKAYPEAQVKIPDKFFTVLSYSEIKRWLDIDPLKEMWYAPNFADCDDFALESRWRMKRIGRTMHHSLLYAYCEGDAPAGYHAFNLVICSKRKIWIIEPQNNIITPYEESNYHPDFIQF